MHLDRLRNLICRYTANKSMTNCAFCNADGDFLIVPQQGSMWMFLSSKLILIFISLKQAFFFFLTSLPRS